MGIKNALVMALGLALAAGSAQAFTGTVGIDPHGSYKFTLGKGDTFDTIKFSLTKAEDFDFKLFSSFTSGGPVTGSFELFDTTTASVVDMGTYTNSVPSFTSLDLSKGKYSFLIIDSASRPVTNPVLHLDVKVSPVPEPQTYAMLLAGLAFVGVTFARRRPVSVGSRGAVA